MEFELFPDDCDRFGEHTGTDFLWAVRWYCRYGISYRDLEQMMGERGVGADHSTIYRWVQKYAPEIESGCGGTGGTRDRRVGGSMRRT